MAAAASAMAAPSTKCASAPSCTTTASGCAAGARHARSCTTISWKTTRDRSRRRSRAGSFSRTRATAGRPCRLLQALNDADVAHGAVAERAQGFLVAGAVVAGDRLVEAGEFGDDQPLFHPGFIGRARVAAAEIAHAERRERHGSELGIGGELRGVLDLAIGRDPVGFGHWLVPPLCGDPSVRDRSCESSPQYPAHPRESGGPARNCWYRFFAPGFPLARE